MKKSISIIAAILLSLSVSTVIFAQEGEPAPTERRQIVEGVFVDHNHTPGMMGSQDFIILSENNKEISIFESEGRRIEEVFVNDFDKDGKTDYLVQMDCGGSGGYRDFALLKLDEQNVYKPVWENSYSLPEVEIRNRDNSDSIYIKYLNNPKAEKSPKALAIVSFDKNGTVLVRDSQDIKKQ